MSGTVNFKTVKVEPNDTLWKIAEREMGAGKYYLQLYLLNAITLAKSGREVKSSQIGPDFIWPGQEITIVNGVNFQPSGQ